MNGTSTISGHSATGTTRATKPQWRQCRGRRAPHQRTADPIGVGRGSKLLFVVALVLASMLGLTQAASAHTSSIDLDDFRLDLVADGLSQPTSMAFLPDGRMLVTEKTQGVTIVDPSAGLPAAKATYISLDDVDFAGERGVLNIVLDPDFATTGWTYIFYTGSGGINRVIRYTHQENAGGTTSIGDPGSATVIWQHPNAVSSCCHQGGGMAFGSDGLLYIAVGEDFNPAYSTDLTHGGGKLHRVTKDGLAPTSNPFHDGAGPNVDSIYAFGLRNPFRAQWDTIDDRLLISVVGGNNHTYAHESVFAGREGANYGWPACGESPTGREPDGSCTDPSYDDPIFAYAHDGGQASVTGGFRYAGTEFPSELHGAYFFADFVRGWINYLTFDGDGDVVDEHQFISLPDYDAGNVVDLKEGPDGAMYYVQIAGSFPVGQSVNACDGGCLRRVVYESGNASPVITAATATPLSGPAPLAVQFDATATDAEGDTLQFTWDFGDGDTATGASVNHTFTANGPKTVVLSVSDGNSTTTAVLRPSVGVPPTISIDSPANGSTFQAGQSLTFAATAADPDGPVPTDISWRIEFRHNSHFHPVLGPVTQPSINYTVPVLGHSYTDDTAYVIKAVVTDSDGLTATQEIEILPDKVDLTLATSPVDLDVSLDGIGVAVSTPIDTLIGFQHTIGTEDQCADDGRRYTFSNWSHGGAISHGITVPGANVTYTANFADAGPCEPPGAGLVLRLIGDQAGTSAGPVTSWPDASGNGNDLGVIGAAPSLVPFTAGGHSVVSFDGIDDGLGRTGFTGAPTGSGDRTVIMAVEYGGPGWGGLSWGTGSTNKTFGVGTTDAPGAAILGLQGWGPANDFHTSSNALGAGLIVHTVTVDAGVLNQYRNGTLLDSQPHSFATTDERIRLGVKINNSTRITMAVAEALVYDRALSAGEIALVEGYLENTYFGPPGADVVDPFIPAGQSFGLSDEAPNGSVVGTVVATDNVGVTDVAITAGDPGSIFAIDSAGELTLVDESQIVAEDTHVLTITAEDAAGNTASADVVVTTYSGSGLIPGAVLHLEADVGVAVAAGQVTGWADQSGQANDLVAVGDPTVDTAPSGLPALAFDGSGDRLERIGGLTGLPTANDDRTVFFVVDYRSPGYGGFAWGRNSSNQAFGTIVAPNGNLMIQGWGGSNDLDSGDPGTGEGWMLQSAIVDGTTLSHFANGTLVDSRSHTWATGSDRIMLGAEIDGSPQVDLSTAAVVVYDFAMTAVQRQQVENYLTTKYLTTTPDVSAPTIAPGQVFTVSDSAANGSPVGTVTASDNIGVVSYGITAGDPGAVFALDNSGALTVADASQLVAGEQHILTITVADAAANTTTESITIDVSDLGDTVNPVVAAGQTFLVDDETPAGSSVGTVTMTDNVGVVAATITAGNTNGDFAVAASGDLTLVNAVAAPATYSLTIQATDDAGNTGTGVVTVTVTSTSGLVPGAVLLLEGDAGVAMSGQTVTGWVDQSGNGNDLDVVSGNPTTGFSPSGVPVVETDGVLDKLVRTGAITGMPSGSSDRTVFMVVDYRDDGFGGFTWGRRRNNRVFGPVVNTAGDLAVQGWGGGNDLSSSTVGNGAGWLVQTVMVDVNTMTHYADGSLIDTRSHTWNTDPQSIVLGAEFDGSPQLEMSIGAVVVYDRALSAAERQQVESYLSGKYLEAGPDVAPPTIPAGQSFTVVDTATSGQVVGTVVAVDNVGVAGFSILDGDPSGIFAIDNAGLVTVDDPNQLAAGNTHLLQVEVVDAAGNNTNETVTVTVVAASDLVPGAVLILEADIGVTLTGGDVSAWADQSGFGNDLTGIGDPTIVTSPTGAAAISLDGSGDRLERDGGLVNMPVGSGDRTVFLVGEYRSNGFGGMSWGNRAKNRMFGTVVTKNGTLGVQAWGSRNDFDSGVGAVGSGWLVQSAVLDGNAMDHYVDGALIDSRNHSYNTAAGRIVVGAEIDRNPHVDMSVGAIVVYDRALTNLERSQVETYLAGKYVNP